MSPSEAPPAGTDEGTAAIADFAAANPWMGSATGVVTPAYGDGLKQTFQKATVYWSAATGAHSVHGGVAARFNSLPDPLRTLGYPTTGEIGGSGGVHQEFEHDIIYWTPAGGGQLVAAEVSDRWSELGGVGVLGYPVSALVGGGQVRAQQFQSGALGISTTGESFWVHGGVFARWSAMGGIQSFYGLPTSNEIPGPDGGIHQSFERGVIYWHLATGPHGIHGGIAVGYRNLGGSAGFYGYPTSGEIAGPAGGVLQRFQRGTIYWTAALGAHGVHGGIGQVWANAGGAGGFFGYPRTFELPTRDGGVYQVFERGTVYWSAASGAHTVHGGIGQYWNASGSEWGRFGFPTSGEICNNAGCYQNFQYGAITWGIMTGPHDLYKLDARCTYGRVVCADKTTNKMYWVVDGQIQATFDARFGAPGWETANGEMTFFRKEAMSWSVPFSAWMPWSQYFHASGMAIHYSSGFEAEGFPSWGSHGCINMNNYAQAEWLFNQTRMGDRIVVYYS